MKIAQFEAVALIAALKKLPIWPLPIYAYPRGIGPMMGPPSFGHGSRVIIDTFLYIHERLLVARQKDFTVLLSEKLRLRGSADASPYQELIIS